MMCRGDRREAIYEDDTDRGVFLGTLGEVCRRTGWRVHAYALMGNHYHLLIETPEANLVAGMTWFQSTYTKRYNARHKASGHLFGGRYKGVLVEADGSEYFRTLLDYIHLNPVRAGLVKGEEGIPPDLLSYRWTSLGDYAGKPGTRPKFLSTGRGFIVCDLKDGPRGRREFVSRLAERVALDEAETCGLAQIDGQGLQSTLRRGWCYGGATFKERLLEYADALIRRRGDSGSGGYCGDDVRDHGEHRARAVVVAGLAELGLEPRELSDMAKGAEEKSLIAWKIRQETSVPLAWIAAELSMGSASNVSAQVRRMGERVAKQRRLRRLLKAIDSRILT